MENMRNELMELSKELYKEYKEYTLKLDNTNDFAYENLKLIEQLIEYIQCTEKLDREKILYILNTIEENDIEVDS